VPACLYAGGDAVVKQFRGVPGCAGLERPVAGGFSDAKSRQPGAALQRSRARPHTWRAAFVLHQPRQQTPARGGGPAPPPARRAGAAGGGGREGGPPPATDDKVVANKAVCELLDLKAGAAADEVVTKIMELKNGKIGGTNVLEELKALKQQNAERAADDAVLLALKAGKITPAQKDWARSYALTDPKGFGSFVEKAPQVVPQGEIEMGDVKSLKGDTLDEATLLACKQVGVSKEDAQKYGLGKE